MEEGVMTRDDPLLAALADAARRKQRADHDIRLLLAYARGPSCLARESAWQHLISEI